MAATRCDAVAGHGLISKMNDQGQVSTAGGKQQILCRANILTGHKRGGAFTRQGQTDGTGNGLPSSLGGYRT